MDIVSRVFGVCFVGYSFRTNKKSFANHWQSLNSSNLVSNPFHLRVVVIGKCACIVLLHGVEHVAIETANGATKTRSRSVSNTAKEQHFPWTMSSQWMASVPTDATQLPTLNSHSNYDIHMSPDHEHFIHGEGNPHPSRSRHSGSEPIAKGVIAFRHWLSPEEKNNKPRLPLVSSAATTPQPRHRQVRVSSNGSALYRD
jgi:hypothetical protein